MVTNTNTRHAFPNSQIHWQKWTRNGNAIKMQLNGMLYTSNHSDIWGSTQLLCLRINTCSGIMRLSSILFWWFTLLITRLKTRSNHIVKIKKKRKKLLVQARYSRKKSSTTIGLFLLYGKQLWIYILFHSKLFDDKDLFTVETRNHSSCLKCLSKFIL